MAMYDSINKILEVLMKSLKKVIPIQNWAKNTNIDFTKKNTNGQKSQFKKTQIQ